MSTRSPLAPSGVENVHVNKPSGKEDATTTKSGGKAHGNESNMEREVCFIPSRPFTPLISVRSNSSKLGSHDVMKLLSSCRVRSSRMLPVKS